MGASINPSMGTAFSLSNAAHKAVIASLLIQSDGKILVGGSEGDPQQQTMPLLRRLNVDGSPDASFGSAGQAVFNARSGAIVLFLSFAPGGKLVAVAGGPSGLEA